MKKRALLIGINDYKYYRAFPLDGCINDVEILASALREKFGFNEDEIIRLTDKKATKTRIVKEMRDILENCEKDALIVLHFSGHGTRRVAQDTTKPDGLEETIIPYDSPADIDLNRDIYDSDLRDWIALLSKKTKNICFFCDSCYSGSIVRGEKIRGFDTDLTRSLPAIKKSASKNGAKRLFPRSLLNWQELSENYVLIAGCKKNEFAREYTLTEGDKSMAYGAFTYFLVRELRNASEHSTYQDVFEQLCIKMGLNYQSQHPQIEGQNQRRIFTDKQIQAQNYVSVKERSEDEVILLAGATHGITLNSEWGIYEPDDVYKSSPNKIGTVRISEIDVVTARAKIIKESKNSIIKAGSRAVEELHCYKINRTKIFLNLSSTNLKEIKQAIAKTIKKSSWLKLTARERGADFIVSPVIEAKINESDAVQIAIMHARDRQILWSVTSSDEDYHKNICRTLEKLVKFSTVSELQNYSSKLKGLVEFELLQKKGKEWKKAELRYNNLPLFFEGEQLGLQIINKSSVPIYVSVLDLGLTKRISLLYPRRAASERLEKSRSAAGVVENPNLGKVEVGVLPNERINLFIPDEALLSNLPDTTHNGGLETLKLMITTEQTNFSWIELSGLGTRISAKSPLERLMQLYFREKPTRDAEYKQDKETDWFTINRCFYLCKK